MVSHIMCKPIQAALVRRDRDLKEQLDFADD